MRYDRICIIVIIGGLVCFIIFGSIQENATPAFVVSVLQTYNIVNFTFTIINFTPTFLKLELIDLL